MPETLVPAESASVESTSLSPAAVAPAAPCVQQALAAIRQDSLSLPVRYLEATVVPHGGE